jgi:hypothetical protein
MYSRNTLTHSTGVTGGPLADCVQPADATDKRDLTRRALSAPIRICGITCRYTAPTSSLLACVLCKPLLKL